MQAVAENFKGFQNGGGMRLRIISACVFMAVSFLFLGIAHSDELPTVTAIEVKGLKRIEEGAIRSKVSQKIGTSLSQEKTTDDIKTIYKMGYFDDVRTEIEPFEGGIKIVYVVKEKPTIVRVDFQGNKKFEDVSLKEKATITAGAIADINLINDNVAKLRTFYEDEGYYLVKIVPVISKTKAGEALLTYQIDEGQKVKIQEFNLIGNSAMSERKIKKVIKTKERAFFVFWGGYYKKEEMKIDLERIKDLYYNNGFLKVTVGNPQIVLSDDKKSMKITLNISEGPQFKVSSVDVAGNKAYPTGELKKLLKMSPQSVFSKQIMGKDVAALTDKYSDSGYALVSVSPDLAPDDEKKETTVVYKINEGDRYKIGRIEISGNTKTRDKVIRREIRLDEGDVYDSSALKRSEERLKNLQFFETVDVAQKPKQEEKTVDIETKVKEKSTGFLSVGGGYSSVDKLVGMVDITQGNFLGQGQLIKLKGEFGARSSFYELAFRDPWILDYPVSFGASVYKSQRTYGNYERRSTGLELSLGKSFWEYWGVSTSYNLDTTTIYNVRDDSSQYVKDQAGARTTSSISYSIGRDTRNSHLDPTSGSKIALYETFAGLGGTNAFVKALLDAGWFFPMFESSTFHVRGRAGSAGGLLGKELPIYEKYYIGGISTVRGLGYGDAGPKDINGEPLGGFKELIFNTEYIFPIAAELKFKGVVFFDAGRSYGADETFGTGLRHTAGAGVRWISPVGPLRIEWGNNLSPKRGEAASKVEFTFGTFF